MTDAGNENAALLEQKYEFEEPPHKVWRAISVAEVRENWLPAGALADPDPVSSDPGRSVRYRMREPAPPFLESEVTFTVAANGTGGTTLRIVHELFPANALPLRGAANGNRPLMRAA